MLSGEYLTNALKGWMVQMPAFMALLRNDADRIIVHADNQDDSSLRNRIDQDMETPGALIAYGQLLSGNFDGSTLYKHPVKVYLRPGELESGDKPTAYAMLEALTHTIPAGSTVDLRLIHLVPEVDITDPVTAARETDMQGIDLLVAQFTFPEIFDN